MTRDSTPSTLSLLRDLWRLLDARERQRLLLLQAFTLWNALLALIGVAAIVPFLRVLSDSGAVARSEPLAWLYEFFSFSDARSFALALGAGFIALVALSNTSMLYGLMAIHRYAQRVAATLHVELFSEYLHRGYAFHSGTDSSTLATNVVFEVNRLASGILQGALTLTASAAICGFIATGMFLAEPAAAAVAVFLSGGIYLLIQKLARQRLARNGFVLTRLWSERARVINESFGAIKEILLMRNQGFFEDTLRKQCNEIAQASTDTFAITHAPRHLVEFLAAVALVTVAFLPMSGGQASWLARISFLAFATYRLLPALQTAFAAAARLNTDRSGFERIAGDLSRARSRRKTPQLSGAENPWPSRAPSGIQVSAANFRHGGANRDALRDATLEISAGSIAAFIGTTGAGKTTLAELILGLLTPDSGRIEIDGIALGAANLAAWQARTAYVPQHAFLHNASIAENIALGVPAGEVNRQRVRQVMDICLLDETGPVGERGVRLSGGQRQLVGLARALYRDASLLVLDEATSALDVATERAVFDALFSRPAGCTCILIAHRESTVRVCDIVFEFQAGAVRQRGAEPRHRRA